ncbi:MAG TPA: hypothetical protein P5254_05785 [Aquihabitans sp.]|nr:hypothetical protein [Aquihabitans sp.]
MRRWGVHVVGYLALLLVALVVVGRTDSWNFDDGAYAIQAKVIDETGGWAYPYAHEDLDPTFRFAPVDHATTTTEGTFPYVKQPAWVEAIVGARALVGGSWGRFLPSILGAVAAALAAGLLAERIERGSGPVAFWVVGLGPVLVHGQAMWAHTAAAALGGAAALALVALHQGRAGPQHVAALALATAGLVLIRAEGLLFAAALAVVLVVGAAARHGRTRAAVVEAATWAGAAILGAILASASSSWWSGRIAPGPLLDDQDVALREVGYAEGRVRGAARTLLDGVGASTAGTALAVLVLVLAVLAGLAVRRGRTGDGAVLLALAAAAVVLRALVAPSDLGGTVVAAPVLVAGLAAWSWRAAPLAERSLVLLGGVHLLAVLATQYPEGGSRDWGGRFLFPVLVPATVVAVVALRRALVPWAERLGPSAERRPVTVAVVLLVAFAAVPTAAGLRSAADLRASNAAFRSVSEAVGSEAPTVIRTPRYLSRTSWNALPGADWLAADGDDAIADALELLRPGRTAPVAVVGPGADAIEADGWEREVLSPVAVVLTPT